MNLTTRSGQQVEIDDDRLDLAAFTWTTHNGYVCRYVVRTPGVQGRVRRIWLHHEVLGTVPQRGVHIDHIDMNQLNNRRANLRVANASQNAQNRQSVSRTGRVRGVSWKADQGSHGKWCGRATINYRTYHIGYFETEEAAADAVAEWRRQHMTHSTQDGGH